MKKNTWISLGAGIITASFIQSAAAATLDISLDVNDWTRDTGYSMQEPYSTMENTPDGHLRATTEIDRGGTPYAINSWTVDTYNFQNTTLQFQWKVNATDNAYSAVNTGLQDPSIYHVYEDGYFFTTNHSWDNSTVIANDTWLYTELSFNETGYTYSVSYQGYGQTDFLTGSYSYSSTTWDSLADAHFWFSYGDVYKAGSYYELAEAQIIQPDSEPVPEPATMLLFGTGLAGLAGWRKRKNAR